MSARIVVALLLSALACGGAARTVPLEPVFESVDVHVGDRVHLQHVPAVVALEEMQTSLAVGGMGHFSDGRFEVRWDDGSSEVYAGALPLVGCSRGYVFTLDGMNEFGAIWVQGPDHPCPRQ